MPSYGNRFNRAGKSTSFGAQGDGQDAMGGNTMGVSKLKMPTNSSSKMPRGPSTFTEGSALGSPLTALPKAPLGPFKGPEKSLMNTSDNKSRRGFQSIGLKQ